MEAVRRGDPAARSVAMTLDGKRRVDAMRTGFDAFIATERRLVRAQQGRSDEAARRAVAAAVGGLVVSLLLVLLFTGYLTRALVGPVRRAAQMAVRLAGGNLSTRMPATGVAEIGQLEWAFNDLAGSLERNRDDLARWPRSGRPFGAWPPWSPAGSPRTRCRRASPRRLAPCSGPT